MANYIIGGLLIAAVVVAFVSWRKQRKKGCGGGCRGCAFSEECKK